MFRAITLPIFRNTILCVTAYGIIHPRCCGRWPATLWVHYTTSCNTQSSAPQDGRDHRPKHVELTDIINKPLLLHRDCCLYYLCQWCTVKQISDNEIYLLIKYIKSVPWRVAKCLSYIEEARCLKGNAGGPAGWVLGLEWRPHFVRIQFYQKIVIAWTWRTKNGPKNHRKRRYTGLKFRRH
jgi:hypothetical protein